MVFFPTTHTPNLHTYPHHTNLHAAPLQLFPVEGDMGMNRNVFDICGGIFALWHFGRWRLWHARLDGTFLYLSSLAFDIFFLDVLFGFIAGGLLAL